MNVFVYQMDFIKLPPSVYQTMVTHALTHEREEIAGLLCSEVMLFRVHYNLLGA